MKAKGPGKGHVRPTPQSPSPHCALCGHFIFELAARSINGRWQHLPDKWGRCPSTFEEKSPDD
jgi:hypothetical protein